MAKKKVHTQNFTGFVNETTNLNNILGRLITESEYGVLPGCKDNYNNIPVTL
jgi:hypothetical protein